MAATSLQNAMQTMRETYSGFLRKTGTAFSLVSFWVNESPKEDQVTPESLTDLAFKYRGIAPSQVRSELREFASVVRELRPKAFLEIGTRTGGTFFVICRLADPGATAVSLDLPGGRFGGGYGFYQIPVIRRMHKPKQQLHLIREDSHNIDTPGRVARILNGSHLDLLFIDGDHTYSGVKRDFEMYSPFVRPGGIVVFHDILPHVSGTGCEVDRFWNEIKPRYRHREIIENPQQGWAGIGILFVN